jgi:hypothetical protein
MTKLLSLADCPRATAALWRCRRTTDSRVTLEELKILRESDKKASNVKSNPPTTTGSGTLKGKGYDYLWNRLWVDPANTEQQQR